MPQVKLNIGIKNGQLKFQVGIYALSFAITTHFEPIS